MILNRNKRPQPATAQMWVLVCLEQKFLVAAESWFFGMTPYQNTGDVIGCKMNGSTGL